MSPLWEFIESKVGEGRGNTEEYVVESQKGTLYNHA